MIKSHLNRKYCQIAIASSIILTYLYYVTPVKTYVQVALRNSATKVEMPLAQSFPENGEPKGRRRGGTNRVFVIS